MSTTAVSVLKIQSSGETSPRERALSLEGPSPSQEKTEQEANGPDQCWGE